MADKYADGTKNKHGTKDFQLASGFFCHTLPFFQGYYKRSWKQSQQ